MSVFGPRPVDRRPAGCRKYKPAATRGGGDGGAGVKPWRHSFTYYVNSLEFRSRVCLLPGAVVRTRAAQRSCILGARISCFILISIVSSHREVWRPAAHAGYVALPHSSCPGSAPASIPRKIRRRIAAGL